MKNLFSALIITAALIQAKAQCPVSLSVTNVSCNSLCDGSITATPSGSPPFTFMWAPNPQNTQVATGLCAGTYTVTVTDANNCTATASATVLQPSAITVSLSQVNVYCNSQCNGSATATVFGGTPGYTFSWAPSGGNGATATGLCAGNYTCIVTDAN